MAVALVVYWSLYAGSAWLGDLAPIRYRLYFDWEPAIPLVPVAALVYLSISFMLIPLWAALPTPRQLWPVLVTLNVQGLTAALCFWLLPLEDGFPPAHPAPSWSVSMWRLANQLALRHNYFPSLHVSLSASAAMVLSRCRGSIHWPMVLWAAAIAVSTLLIHQHHLIDVAGGLLLAYATVRGVYDRMVPA